jgi:signal transduction histidine kinase/CheY-like chemotaxis protein
MASAVGVGTDAVATERPVNGNEGAMTDEARRLQQLIGYNLPVTPLGIAFLLILYGIWHSAVLLILAGSILPTLVLQRIAIRHTRRNEVAQGITALAAGIWCPALTLAIVAPAEWGLTITLCILSVVLALPFANNTHLLRLIWVASGILAVGAVFGALDPLISLSPPIPLSVLRVFQVTTAMIGAVLCMVSISASGGRLRDSLQESEAANAALTESERTLEAKVTERTIDLAESQRALAAARDEAVRASHAKSDFLANMSHELRTPLNAIIGYGEMLEEEARDNEHDEYLPDIGRVVASGKYLLTLINGVLDLSKIEAGKMEVYIESFELDPFMQGVEATIMPLVRKNSNALEVTKGEALGSMDSDKAKVRQVLFNLLSNASKFTREGTIFVDVSRETGPDGDFVRFAVRDTGIGMTPEQLERIFEAFSQAEETTAREYGGTGLGLAITKQFCEMLGGSIFAESSPGGGSVFVVTLPVRAPSDVRSTADEASKLTSTGTERSTAVVRHDTKSALSFGTHTTVLVVDDDPQARDLLTRFLNREGFEVITAAAGEQALRLAQEHHPNVITLDVMMPGMDGWEVLRSLKADAVLSEIPVVLLTITDDKNLGYALGASEYLTKPVDYVQLARVLNRFHVNGSSVALVVDDDNSARDMTKRALLRAGWRVREATNGREALAALEEGVPSLILLDLLMPEMDGFEFAAALHDNPVWRSIPVIVITAIDVSAKDRIRLGGGIEHIFQKGTYNLAELVEEIHRIVTTGERTLT